MALKCIFHVLSFEHIGLIEFAGETPGRGEIDKNRVALLQFSLQSFRTKRLPRPRKARIGGSDFRRLKFVADQVNAAPEDEHQHEYRHDGSLRTRGRWRNEGTFHPARDADHKKETARPA